MLDLAVYDWLLVNNSAGKDSQAMLDLLVDRLIAGETPPTSTAADDGCWNM